MNQKKGSSINWQLYAILDTAVLKGKDLVDSAMQMVKGGADCLQLRDKGLLSQKELIDAGTAICALAKDAGVSFIVNDKIDIALVVDADGVHLGQNDTPIKVARRMLPKDKLIGISTHSLAQAVQAESSGADYIGFGPIYPTPTKPDYKSVGLTALKEASREISIPLVAIGGINKDNILEVLKSGARIVAVVRAGIIGGDIETAIKALKGKITEYDAVRICN